jgi:outer membrane protein OmpA-like peptidoglycan-associated protein
MRKLLTYLLLFSALVCFTHQLNAQEINAFDRSTPFITAYFLEENLIIEPEATFFNVVIIKNEGQVTEEIIPEINLPLGWSLIISETQSYMLEPGDSVILPVRAAPSKGVEGEIGYSVIASVNDKRGETLANAYSFVKIPRKSDLRIRPLTRVSLFDQVTNEAEFSFLISNKGNVSELVLVVLESSDNIAVPNEKENLFSKDLMIRARSDTIITMTARKMDDNTIRNGNFFRIDMKATSQEKEFQTSFWFDQLTSSYSFEVPDSEKMLVLELAAQNLLSSQRSYLVGGFRGILLFPEKKSLTYNFYKYGTDPNLMKYSRIRLEYNTPNFTAGLGDITGYSLRNGFGKGAFVSIRYPEKLRTTIMVGENPFRPITNFGIIMDENATNFRFLPRYSFTQNRFLNSQAQTFGLGTTINLTNQHRIRANLGFSLVDFNNVNTTEPGYGLTLDYSGLFEKISIRMREQFGTSQFYGNYAGRHEFTGRVNYRSNETTSYDLIVNDRNYQPVIESASGTTAERFQQTSDVKLIMRKNINRNFNVYGGPVYGRKSTNSFFLYDDINPFSSQSAKVNLGVRLRDGLGTTFNPAATLGYTFITSYSLPEENVPAMVMSNPKTSPFNSHISINLRRNYWGLYLNYFYGPYSVNQEITQFYYNITTNSIRLMPYFDRFIYKDQVKLSSKVSFLHDFSFKTTRLILNNQIDFFLPNDYTVSVLNTFSQQVTTDLLTEDNYTYNNNYFELRVKKEFNWNQPRIKYYDLKVNLFKDMNGNLNRDANEPGVKDVIVSITSIDPILYSQYGADYEVAGSMVASRLLTSTNGEVVYENLARGIYKIELQNIGSDQAKYFPDQNEIIIKHEEDQTTFVPYLERNKIFGKVILNRSRLSTLGRIEVSNIKITATDSKGRQTSTLSDAEGNFEMYVPSVDSYIVTINNIFRDHFTLRQNDFRANLNGFKQFEVNFVFDEIRRQIEFTPSPSEIQAEIRRVGRTNLSGTVRDAATLQPIRAQVEVVDNRNGNTIVQTSTDRASGRYTTSFATGEDYMIVVSANGYWMHSERLILDQFLTIQDAERDILLQSITIGARFQLNNLRFTSGSIEIPTEALPELDRLIAQLKQNPNVKIRIEGHSDAAETLDNPNISMQRAETIMRYMVRNGFSNIEFTGLKDARPVAPSDTEDNRRRNRRVEIIVIER